ncbi:MAG TPA: hypothetical protein VGE76_24195 [Opitutaceae bacterium]
MTKPSRSSSLPALAVLGAVLGLPLAGALAAGRPLAEFTEFPPRVSIPEYTRFSAVAAGAVMLLLVAVAIPWARALRHSGSAVGPAPGDRPHAFPAWGWAALGWTGAWWVLAWTRWEWFAPLQRYTFFPLWLGFIVAFNAAAERRTGSCLMRRATGRWLALFAISAACWWGFEWLNRFVLNWHYLGAEGFGAWAYFLHATFCFATVLPAVAAVAEWLDAHPGWRARVSAGPRWEWLARREASLALLILGGLSLFGTGFWPTWMYPALWVSPLALLLGAQGLRGVEGVSGEMARGDWSRAATWMAASLVCGFFWEMWNWQSVAKWIYTVPGVERWHLFEMPALGYAGYLPFGLECLLVAERVIGDRWREHSRNRPTLY